MLVEVDADDPRRRELLEQREERLALSAADGQHQRSPRAMTFGDEPTQSKTLILERLSFDLDISVQVFEVNIRLLGGLLAAYQLDGDEAFLTLADDLGRRLLPAFDSPTGMPYRFLNLRSGEKNQPVSNPAEIGPLTLEFGTLGRLTGNQKFFQAAKAAVVSLFERRSSLDLVGSRINVETGEWLEPRSHVGGRIDSYYR